MAVCERVFCLIFWLNGRPHFICVPDRYTKEIIGYFVSSTSQTSDCKMALNHAINVRFPNGILTANFQPCLISDNGCQPTAMAFMKACSELKSKPIFATWNNPTGNADTKRVFLAMKEDLVWTNDWDLPFQFQHDLEHWTHDDNTDYPHQSLQYQTPCQMMAHHSAEQCTKKEVVTTPCLTHSFFLVLTGALHPKIGASVALSLAASLSMAYVRFCCLVP